MLPMILLMSRLPGVHSMSAGRLQSRGHPSSPHPVVVFGAFDASYKSQKVDRNVTLYTRTTRIRQEDRLVLTVFYRVQPILWGRHWSNCESLTKWDAYNTCYGSELIAAILLSPLHEVHGKGL